VAVPEIALNAGSLTGGFTGLIVPPVHLGSLLLNDPNNPVPMYYLALVIVVASAITAIARRRADELGFGERKLVDLGRALIGRPSLVLLDEPASGLAEGQKAWLAQRGIVLANGAIDLQGSAADLLASDLVRRAYLGA
jgi:ABC-type branched-subunit amino acid transport system ATPase component